MKRCDIEINRESDFDFLITLKDENGELVGFPSYDFIGELFPKHILEFKDSCDFDWQRINGLEIPNGIKPFVFSKIGDKLTNCFEDNGCIHVVVDGNNFPHG